MGDLSKNFSRSEFACKGKHCCSNSAVVHPDLITALQELRELIGFPLRIASGFRCNKHNHEIGGASGSFHTIGMAADISCPVGFTAQSIAAKAEQIELFKNGGIGIYPTWIHVDVRKTGKARWTDG